MLELLFIVDCFFAFLVIKKYGFVDFFSLTYCVAFIYLNALHLDYFLFGLEQLNVTNFKIEVNIFSYSFLQFKFYSSIFLGLLGLCYLYFNSKNHSRSHDIFILSRKKYYLYVFLLGLVFIGIWEAYQNFGLTRALLGIKQTPFSLIFYNFKNFIFVFVLFSNEWKNKIVIFYLVIQSFLFFLSLEREPLLILFLCILFRFEIFKNPIYTTLSALSAIFIIFSYKSFYQIYFYGQGDFDDLSEIISSSTFSIASLDPGASIFLCYDYFRNPEIYSEYSFSYLFNTIAQLLRTFDIVDHTSLAEYASKLYVNSEYGLAFSFLLESFLNFGVFGPFMLGITLPFLFKKILFNKRSVSTALIVLAIFIFSKYMRTELATLLKLQIIPLLIAIITMNFFSTKNTNQ